jgi:hypothetical protein
MNLAIYMLVDAVDLTTIHKAAGLERRSHRAMPERNAAESDDEDLLAVPVEVLAGRQLSVGGEEQGLPQRWPPVVLPSQRVSRGGVGQRAGNVDA